MEDIIEEILQEEIEDETDADGVGDAMQVNPRFRVCSLGFRLV